MKIYFVLLCLLISSVWAKATVQNAANQDKPSRLYVKGYNLTNDDLQTIDQNVYNGGNFIIPYQEKMNWQDGGAGSYFETYMDSNDFYTTSSVLSQSWPPSFWPNITAVQINSSFYNGWPYWTNENSSATNTSAPVYVYQEHCDVTFTSYSTITTFPPGVNPDPYYINKVNDRRIADTTMHLQTGGKAISNLKNLFGISASATQNNPANYSWDLLPGNEGYGLYLTNIPSQEISIGNYGTLNTNGVKYLILADNSDVDVTPYSAGSTYYSFNESQQEYKLHIVANGNPLAQDHVRNGANFCVGQQVTFQALFTPPVPGLVSTNVTWNYTLDYINNYYTNSDGCEIYNDAPIPAMSNPTTAWFCNGQTQNGTAELGVYCQFGNGQTAYLVRQGMFNVFTPSITVAPQNPPGPPSVNIDSVDLQPVIRIGLTSTNSGQLYDLMAFDANVVSELQFPGEVIVTQLINRNTSIDGVSFGGTGGSYYLDSNVVYPQSDDAVSANISGSECVGTSSFGDGPYIGIQEASWASINDHFQTYFRFRPSGTGNIYVTLGLVNWDWNAYVQYTGINPLSLSSWTISSSGIDGPTFTPSNVFPQWSSTY